MRKREAFRIILRFLACLRGRMGTPFSEIENSEEKLVGAGDERLP